ncbi:MAG: hypothetical protein K8T20_20155 [Planctomycetes bacterium]|nr:hypothetical protein [Planctomycetota bacterium]
MGQFKEPFSLETLEETKWWDFLENSVVYMHAPVPELGAMVYGTLPFFPKVSKYFIGVFNGNTASLATAKGADENSDKDIAARYQVDLPGLPLGCNTLPGYFHAAVSFTQGRQRRDAPATPFPMFDPSTGTFFQTNPGTTAFRTLDLTRVNVEAAIMVGPVELKGEYSVHRSKVAFGEDKELFTSQGYFGQAGVWLGGSRKPLGVPEVDSALFDGGFGAVQIAGRFAQLRMDDDFERRAGFLGARRVREWCAVVNWFPNRSVRVSLQYAFVEYSHGEVVLPSGRSIHREDVLLFRVQVSF